MSDAARLFLALWPDTETRRRLIEWRDSWTWPRGATPVHDDKLHLTLHFIGDVERARIAALRAQLGVAMVPFELEFGTATVWPHGIAVLEPLAIPAALTRLHATLGKLLDSAGLPPESRPYKPHVTMARRAAKAAVPGQGPQFTWAADGYALMASSGGSYTILESYR